MPSFLHPSLLWGLAILGVPVLIHLVHLMRHRRVQWAAMEFLLQSQKKNRAWILLKQLLLLAMRMAAVAAVVLLVAQPLLHSQWSALVGGAKTHHIVLLDDSFSMADRWADTSAFAQAKEVVRKIGSQAAGQDAAKSWTLLRFSRAGQAAGGTQPDLLDEPIDAGFGAKLEDTLGKLAPSETAAGPAATLDAIGQLLGKRDGENRIVYLVSDFRAKEWTNAEGLKKSLSQLRDSGARIHLVNCVEAARPNLALAALRPAPGTIAAGVPLFIEVSVKNFGRDPAKDVSVRVEEDGQRRPAVPIGDVAPGQTETRRFAAQFLTAGQHRVTATLEGDAVLADNARYCVVEVPLGIGVLIVDAKPGSLEGRFLATALAPGGPVKTGLEPKIERPSFLAANPLGNYRAIYLVNVDRLDQAAVDALGAYVRSGGGLGMFLGEETRAQFVNDALYQKGKGWFPLPLAGPAALPAQRGDKTADLEVTDHPIFRVFAGERNSFLGAVAVDRYFAPVRGWNPKADPAVSVIALLRNGDPLAVERKFGEGRVVVFLTSAAPTWNNWGRNPSFVVAMLEMQSYLALRPGAQDAPRLVGAPLSVTFDAARFQPRVRFVTPQAQSANSLVGDAVPTPKGFVASLTETAAAGFYEAQLTTTGGKSEVRDYALNVAPEEGDLKRLTGEQLASRLAGVPFEYHQAAGFDRGANDRAGSNLGDSVLYFLVLLLVGEQVLAYSASYHPPRAGRVHG
ncbi:MAG: BatA domain-containing protein [Pirellulales bacterium]